MTFENVSEDKRGAVFGIIQVTRAIATILASLIVGYLVNIHGHYGLAYPACIVLAAIGILAAWFLKAVNTPPSTTVMGATTETKGASNVKS